MTSHQRIVFITGAEGFLGRHAARRFDDAGWRVIGIGRRSLPAGDPALWGIRATYIGDVEPHLLSAACHAEGVPDTILHAAGTSSVGQSAQNPFGEFSATVGATAAVIDFMREQAPKAKLIYLSSAAVYGNALSNPIPVSAPAVPISIYGLHKHLSEQLILNAASIHGLTCHIVRFFSIYGPGLAKQILWDVVRRVEGGESPLRLGGNGGETRDFLYVEDAVRLLLAIAEGANPPWIVNGGTGNATAIRDLVRLLLKSWSPQVELVFSGDVRPGDPRHLVAEVGCLGALGFASQTPLDHGLRSFAEWARLQIGGRGEEARISRT